MGGAFNYTQRWLRTTWDVVGQFDLIVGALGAGFIFLNWVDWLSEDTATRLLTLVALLLVGGTVVAAVWIAPYLSYREVAQRLDAMTTVPPLGVTVVPPLEWVDQVGRFQIRGHLLRLMIENHSDHGHHLHARVVGADGIPPGPEPPWWAQWRNGQGIEHLLLPGDREMLELGFVGPLEGNLKVRVPGGADENHAFSFEGPITLYVKIWHSETTLLIRSLAVNVDTSSTPIGFDVEDVA